MKYKTLFRLGLKLVGVVFIVLGVGGLIETGTAFLMTRSAPFGSSVLMWTIPLLGLPSKLFSIAIGAYLFFGGKWIVDKAIPSNRPYRPNCGYDLTGAVTERCTECGTPFRAEDVRPPAMDNDPPTDSAQSETEQPERTE